MRNRFGEMLSGDGAMLQDELGKLNQFLESEKSDREHKEWVERNRQLDSGEGINPLKFFAIICGGSLLLGVVAGIIIAICKVVAWVAANITEILQVMGIVSIPAYLIFFLVIRYLSKKK